MGLVEKNIFVTSANLGCAMNANETSIIEHAYSIENCAVVSAPEKADTIVINTCAATNEAEEYSINTVKKLKAQYPSAKLVITGCLPRINPKRVKGLRDVFTTSIDDYIKKIVATGDSYSGFKIKNTKILESLPARFHLLNTLRSLGHFFEEFRIRLLDEKLKNILETGVINPDFRYILTSQGCKSSCAFCVIKKAKGSIKSRSLREIENEVMKLTSENEKKFWLLADDLGCWGYDINSNVYELLNSFLNNNGVENVVLGNFDPTYLIRHPNVIDILGHSKFKLVNFPIQSGSNRILNLMNRNHPIEQVLPLLQKLRRANKNLVFKTNVIVGFPGEKWTDFLATFKLIRHFDLFYVMLYSERPGTAAEKISSKVSKPVAYLRKFILDFFVVLHYISQFAQSVFRFAKS